MRIKRIIVGILIGAAIGAGLECVNVFFAFFMPPFFVFLPSSAIVGGCIGALMRTGADAGATCTPHDIERLPACGAEFIVRLGKRIRYRHKVREEVQAELAAHFEDDLKDCLTEGQREQKAEKLITDFGDLDTLAILMRRAKKRCRPLWRTALARTFQAACVLILCFVFYVIWFSTGEPTISVDYVAFLNRMSKPEVRSDDNAWPHYERAIGLYVPQTPVTEELISYRRNSKQREKAMQLKKLLGDHRQEILEWLGKNEQHWDNLNAERQAVVLKCLEFNQVPFFQKAHGVDNDWRVATFQWMNRHVVRCITDGAELTALLIGGPLPDSFDPGFPDEELTKWLKDRTVPGNFSQAVSVALLREADKRYGNLPEDIWAPIAGVEHQYIGSWIKQNEQAWKEFATASRKSYCYRPYANDPNDDDETIWNVQLPHLRGLRHLTFLGSWRSRIDREQGRLQQSIENSLAITRAGRHWQGRGTIHEQLIGVAMNALSYDEVLKLIETGRLSAAELADLQDRLSQIHAEGFPTMNMEGERLFVMDVIQRSFTDGGPGGGHLIPRRWGEYADAPGLVERELRLLAPIHTAASMAHAGRDATVALANELYDRQIRLAKMTPYERHASNLKMPMETIYSLPRHRFLLIRHLLPASGRVYEIAYRGKMHYESAVTILAIERWRLEKNECPETLSELVVAGFIKELPTDPYSDEPLVYRRADDDFILYSVGLNFRDEYGEVAIERDRPMRWGTREAGDIIFWPPSKHRRR